MDGSHATEPNQKEKEYRQSEDCLARGQRFRIGTWRRENILGLVRCAKFLI